MEAVTRYHIGTSGWHYGHWRGVLYPEDLPPDRWFEAYAQKFETVELNNSFYRQPKASTWKAWHDEAPPGFRFAVKANRFISHIKRFNDCEKPLRTFLDGARLLKSYLGPVLYQTPPNFERTAENLERLDLFMSLLPTGIQHAFEFRHNSWFRDETLELLRRHGVALCVHDMPGLQPPKQRTAGFVYLRLHGGETAYAGNYSEEALSAWAGTIDDLTRGNAEAWVYFNNDLEGHAVRNALRLRQLLNGA
jgi:uncharacterized protein YecE (DUF72 family)